MGEIGVPRREYLYDLTICDLLMIERGYYRRNREQWSMTRWHAYQVMASFCGSKNLAQSGINSPRDLIAFPWERRHSSPISDEEAQQLQAEMDYFNSLRNLNDKQQ